MTFTSKPKDSVPQHEERAPYLRTVRIGLIIESELWKGSDELLGPVTLRGPAAEMALAVISVAIDKQPAHSPRPKDILGFFDELHRKENEQKEISRD